MCRHCCIHIRAASLVATIVSALVDQVTVGADDLTANYRVEQHVEVVEERERDGKLLRLLATCHKSRCDDGGGGWVLNQAVKSPLQLRDRC